MSIAPSPPRASAATAPSRRPALAGLIVLIALNLRTAMSSVPPVLDEITRGVPLTAAMAGLLTTLPVLCMALCSPLAPLVARRVGHEAGLVLVALTIAAGILVRVPGGPGPLFAGTVLAGIGIAVGNILVPALIARDFQDRVGLMTGVYTMLIGASAALAAGLTIPIEEALGVRWNVALGVWAPFAIVAALVALRFALRRTEPSAVAAAAPTRRALWRDGVAVQVTLWMGVQSLFFFSEHSWLSAIMQAERLSRGSAGALLSVMTLANLPTSLLVPIAVGRRRDQRAAVVLAIAGQAVGLLGLLLAPGAAPALWAIILGLSQGGTLGLAFLFFTLRTSDAIGAGRLAAMAQTVGYLIAAAGPLAFGVLHDRTGGWNAPLAFLLLMLVPLLVVGWAAGRDRVVER